MNREELYQKISERVNALFGMQHTEKQYDAMICCVRKAADELGKANSIEKLYEWISNENISDSDLQKIANQLTIGETYFFREPVALDFFTQKIIPILTERKKGFNQNIKIWSAGCSTGEEPYTIAMLLKESIPAIQDWKITILATDLNTNSLQKARSGAYTRWSFRNTTEHHKLKYFDKTSTGYSVKPDLTKMVIFRELNLNENFAPSIIHEFGHFDLIFCRNVLMYFSRERAIAVSNQFHKIIHPESWFITSQTELVDDYFGNFSKEYFNQGVFYKKSGTEERNTINLKTSTKKLVSERKHTLQIKKQVQKPLSISEQKHISRDLIIKRNIEHFQAADYQKCLENGYQFIQSQGYNKVIAHNIIKSLANLGRLEEAKKQAEIFLAKDNFDDELLKLHATILMENGDLQAAEKVLIKLLYLNPNNFSAQYLLANIQWKLGKIKIAKKQFENFLTSISKLDNDNLLTDFDGLTVGRMRILTENILLNL